MSFARHKPEERLEAALRFVRELLDREQERPAVVVLEQTWLGRNFATANKLAELRDAIREAAASRGFEVMTVAPRAWMQSAGIPMRADRATVKRMSRQVAALRAEMDASLLSEDASDAVNLGWHAAGVLRMRRVA